MSRLGVPEDIIVRPGRLEGSNTKSVVSHGGLSMYCRRIFFVTLFACFFLV